jgi:potassium-transporting ATPase KdpC subunit
MKKDQLLVSLRFFAVVTVLTGIAYPLLVTGVAQVLFPRQARGSLIRQGDKILGSSLIGQSFTRAKYFHGRPSAAGNGYDPMQSGPSNLGPTSQKLMENIQAAIEQFRKANPDYSGPVPIDMVTASASGLDPDISLEAAHAQIPRVAKARGAIQADVARLVESHSEGRQWGFLGEGRVNVLLLNMALDRELPQH